MIVLVVALAGTAVMLVFLLGALAALRLERRRCDLLVAGFTTQTMRARRAEHALAVVLAAGDMEST